jgi:hypothetical protein
MAAFADCLHHVGRGYTTQEGISFNHDGLAAFASGGDSRNKPGDTTTCNYYIRF